LQTWWRYTNEASYNYKEIEEWAKVNFVQLRVLREVADLHQDIIKRIKYYNLPTFELLEESNDTNNYKPLFIKVELILIAIFEFSMNSARLICFIKFAI